jgi:hypothetical protein
MNKVTMMKNRIGDIFETMMTVCCEEISSTKFHGNEVGVNPC